MIFLRIKNFFCSTAIVIILQLLTYTEVVKCEKLQLNLKKWKTRMSPSRFKSEALRYTEEIFIDSDSDVDEL